MEKEIIRAGALSFDRQSSEMLLLRGDAELVRATPPVLPGRLVELDADAGVVYAVQGRPRTPVKIGYSRADALSGRIASLQTGNPHPLRVLAHAPGYRSHEARAHAALLHVKCLNEWFRCSPELTAFVMALRRGNIETAIAAAKLAARDLQNRPA